MRLLVPLIVLGLASGCLDLGASRPSCAITNVEAEALPNVISDGAQQTDPTQAWDALFHIVNLGADAQLGNVSAPPGWTARREAMGPNTSNLWRVRLEPSAQPQGGAPGFDWIPLVDGQAACPPSHRWSVRLDTPQAGQRAAVGQGALVYTAGFWENGTLFYTNIPEVDASSWPRAGWYAWEGGDPLPVYVYGNDRSEEPAYWNACAPSPPGDGQCAWSYFTTIPGFNEALKGLSTHTARVVHMTPEKAYTRPGNEAHPLYGDALIFWIRIVEVHENPCPNPDPAGLCDGVA